VQFRTLAGDFAECAIFSRCQRSRFVVGGKQLRHPRALRGRIKGGCRNIRQLNSRAIQIPTNRKSVAESPQPGVRPRIEAAWDDLARQLAVTRRKRLELMQRPPVSRRPRRQRKRQTQRHERCGSDQAQPICRPPKSRKEHQPGSQQEQRCFRANERAKSNDDPAEEV